MDRKHCGFTAALGLLAAVVIPFHAIAGDARISTPTPARVLLATGEEVRGNVVVLSLSASGVECKIDGRNIVRYGPGKVQSVSTADGQYQFDKKEGGFTFKTHAQALADWEAHKQDAKAKDRPTDTDREPKPSPVRPANADRVAVEKEANPTKDRPTDTDREPKPLPVRAADADGEAVEKEAYARFADHLSMPFYKDGVRYHTGAETESADFAAIADFKSPSLRIREAQRECRFILPLYRQGQQLYDKGNPTREDLLALFKDSPEIIKAGWDNDTARQAEFIVKELMRSMDRADNMQRGKVLYFQAKGLHVHAWSHVIPIGETNAGARTDKKVLDFSILQQRLPDPIHFRIQNLAGVELHNVTLYIDSGLAVSDMDGARKHYIYLSNWRASETIECPPYLVDSLIRLPGPSIKTNGCLSYSIWCDELRQTKRLDLVMGNPVLSPNGPSAVHRFISSRQ
jgi:hypothetical protein